MAGSLTTITFVAHDLHLIQLLIMTQEFLQGTQEISIAGGVHSAKLGRAFMMEGFHESRIILQQQMLLMYLW